MKKKLTLEQAWKHCLQMWKWIAKEIEQDGDLYVYSLKCEWTRAHPRFGEIRHHCFFCEYNRQSCEDEHEHECSSCPGKLVSKRFYCENRQSYDWSDEPLKFYQKLLELNEKRKAKK